MSESWLEINDSFQVFTRTWKVDSPKATIVISHGMAEHSGRYDPIAKYFNDHQFNVLAFDHPGHGRTSEKNGQRGFIAEKDGWAFLAVSFHTVLKSADQPVFLLGHSMGAILSATTNFRHQPKIKGLVLSALAFDAGFLTTAGKTLSSLLGKVTSKSSSSGIMNQLTFGDFNKTFKPARTKFDWLSRAHAEVDKYVNDPDCGEVFTHQFFNDLISGVGQLYDHLKEKRVTTPTLLLAGSDDPVVGFEKKFKGTVSKFEASAAPNVQVKHTVFKGARHEIMNEINREEVLDNIIEWCKSQLV
ncbi:MAG: alpha/beta hydrolase [Flavobacteriales bacterium]|nr:alpha/beta hydrolase [Flavobacteriales bacterium]